jgi:hypothetical protein
MRDGDILGGLSRLSAYLSEHDFALAKDRYECLAALHWLTKYLACDNSSVFACLAAARWGPPSDDEVQVVVYERGKYEAPSKDGHFEWIYRTNDGFRRAWVALLHAIVTYVDLVCEEHAGADKAFVVYLTCINKHK